jgi:hypothetical protein
MSTESETFENFQFKERLFDKTGSFTQSIFVFQHGGKFEVNVMK